MNPPAAGLGRSLLRGGTVMVARQIVGAGLGVLIIVIITTLIGPESYGHFAAAQALVQVAVALVPTGIAAALIRRPDEPSAEEWSAAVYLLRWTGVLALGGVLVAAWLIERVTGMDQVLLAALPVALVIPLVWPAQVAVARIERSLIYGGIAKAELLSQVAFAGIAAVTAWLGGGVLAPALAFAAQHLVHAGLVVRMAGGLPPARGGTAGRSLLRYALGWAGSAGIWQARHLVNPLVVGTALGPQAVGQVALLARVVETLSVAKGVASRVGSAGLGRVADDAPATRALVNAGMPVLVASVALPLLMATLAILVVPVAWFGAWQPALAVWPGLCIQAIAGALAVLWTGVLLVRGRFTQITVFHTVHVALLAVAAVILVPRYGLLGFGCAEIVAIASFALSWGFAHLAVGGLRVISTLSWVMVGSLGCLAVWWGGLPGALAAFILLLFFTFLRLPAVLVFARGRTGDA